METNVGHTHRAQWQGEQMRKIPRTIVGVVAIVVASSGVAAGSEPLRIRSWIDITVPQPALSALCGFAVLRRIEGRTDVRLFLDAQGAPQHEIDSSPALVNTYFATATGKSISYPGTGTLITDYYSDGTALASVDGLLTVVHVPGDSPLFINVGRLVFTADVVGVNPDGVPLIGVPKEILFEGGVDHGNVLGACAALAP